MFLNQIDKRINIMNFGKINKYMLLGGGEMLCRFSLYLKQANKDVLVITSERHAEEIIKWDKEMLFKEFLSENKLDYYLVKDINNNKNVYKDISDDVLGLSFGAAWIFKKDIIDKFNGRLLNIHGTKLPRNRGGGGFSWIIMQQELCCYNTIHLVNEGVDRGAIIKFRSLFYPTSCRVPQDFYDYYIKTTCQFLQEFISDVDEEKEINPVSQQEYFSTYWPRLATDIHGYINWAWTLEQIEIFIHAFGDPHKGASTFINGTRVLIIDCFKSYTDGSFHPFQDGIVYRKNEDALYVSKTEGSLIISDIVDEKGKDAKGLIKLGSRLYTPQSYLEKALLYKAIYTPSGLKD